MFEIFLLLYLGIMAIILFIACKALKKKHGIDAFSAIFDYHKE